MFISAPNCEIEMEKLRPIRAELPAVWSDISNAMRGFNDHSLHMLVLDEVLGLYGPGVGRGAGWTASFLAKIYPILSRYLIKEFLQAVVEVSIVELLALFVTFGAENFVKGPAVLLTEGNQNLRLNGLLTLIAITHGNLRGLMNLTRYPEQMRKNVRKFDVKCATDSWNKIRDLRHTLIEYLLQQNRFGIGWDETIQREEDVRRHVGGRLLLTDMNLAMRTDPLALIRGATEL